MRGRHDHALAGGQGRVVQRLAVALGQAGEVVLARLGPQTQGLDGLQRGRAQYLAVEHGALGLAHLGVGQLEVATGDAALTGIETDPQPGQDGCEGTQPGPGQAGEQGSGAVGQAGSGVRFHHCKV
ncbi:hypothetical protein D3C71_1416980 [compost metagenome]